MVKLKKIRLKDYCGYRDKEFDFTENGGVKKLACFYGTNGCGKSTMLQAIGMLCNVYRYQNKDVELLFRKCTYHPDYSRSYSGMYTDNLHTMELNGVFQTDDGDKEVIVTTKGVVKNELPRKDRMGFHYWIDADSPMDLYRFQIHAEMKDRFLDLAQVVYGLDCYMGSKSPDLEDAGQDFYTDFIIEKTDDFGDNVKLHFKSMSGGEKKIATLLRSLCNPLYMDDNDIILIDNICKEVYISRHPRMIKKILEIFADKQLFVVTHSAVLVGVKDEELDIDIPAYLPERFLYNIEVRKPCLKE